MTNKQKEGKEINIFKSLARSNVFSTKSEEQEVNLVWPNLCIFKMLISFPSFCLFVIFDERKVKYYAENIFLIFFMYFQKREIIF
jgi:hypothetical protein